MSELDSISAQLEMMRVQSDNAAATLATATCGAEVSRPCHQQQSLLAVTRLVSALVMVVRQSRAACAASFIAQQVPVGMRNELSQLHGNANKLLATRIDAILTGDPHFAHFCCSKSVDCSDTIGANFTLRGTRRRLEFGP